MTKGISGFETMVMIILTVILIVVGFSAIGWLDPGAKAESMINGTESIKEGYTPEDECKGELSDFRHDMFMAEGTYDGAKTSPQRVSDEIDIICDVPGTAGGGCIFDSFSREQELTDSGGHDIRRGYFSFKFADPPLNKKFEYSCIWDYDTYTESGVNKINWKKDMRDDYDNFKQLVYVDSGENATVKIGFSVLVRETGGLCDSPYVYDVISECGSPSKGRFCDSDGFLGYFWDWSLVAGGYYCCPESGVVTDKDGIQVGTEEGGLLEEEWHWDSERHSCCLGMTCINKECEDLGGKWAYGECWFAGTDSCTEICSAITYLEAPLECSPPEHWGRVPQTCELHEILDLDCSSCGVSDSELSPYITAGNQCFDQVNLIMSTGWCDEPAGSGTRLCSCELV